MGMTAGSRTSQNGACSKSNNGAKKAGEAVNATQLSLKAGGTVQQPKGLGCNRSGIQLEVPVVVEERV